MASCSTMKADEVYVCDNCGLEVKVIKESDGSCCPCCEVICCGKALTKKEE